MDLTDHDSDYRDVQSHLKELADVSEFDFPTLKTTKITSRKPTSRDGLQEEFQGISENSRVERNQIQLGVPIGSGRPASRGFSSQHNEDSEGPPN